MCIHNNHCYKLDSSAQTKLSKLREHYQEETHLDEVSTLTVSSHYKLRNPSLDDCQIHFIDTLDDCVPIIQEATESKLKFITNTDLSDILFEMRKQNYTPSIGFGGNKLLSLSARIGKINLTIENTENTAPEDTIMQ